MSAHFPGAPLAGSFAAATATYTATPTDQEKRLDLFRKLRDAGVSEFSDTPSGVFTVKFFPKELPVSVQQERLPSITGEKLCKCGHSVSEHGGHGLCLRGCAEDSCEITEGE